MTIQSHLRELNGRLTRLERCAEAAPAGTYEHAKDAAAAVNEASQGIIAAFRAKGFKFLNDDRLRNLEAAIYGYLLESNPDDYALMTAEGFGEHVDGPAGKRIVAQAIQNRDTLKNLGVI